MKDLVRILTAHRPLILNYFRAETQFNSEIVEGLNRKINLTVRKSFGFRTLKSDPARLQPHEQYAPGKPGYESGL